MINVYIISGFLGSGKTTFIQHILANKKFSKVMLLENEFGEVGVDGAFFDKSLNVKEINNGCICCSLQGDFADALEEIENMGVTDLIIEPSGVGKLSDILDVVKKDKDYAIVSHICIVDVKTAKKYHLNFKEYFDDQVKYANAIILSHLDVAESNIIEDVKKIIGEINPSALFNTKPITEYQIDELLDLIVSNNDIINEEIEEHEHHHEHEGECCHHHHHDHDGECCHHHDHEHDEECGCHHHHHHDDEDELFKNVVFSPDHIFTKEELEHILNKIDADIIRVKGYVNSDKGSFFFNYVLNEYSIYEKDRKDPSIVCIIGTSIDVDKYRDLFYGA